MLRSASDVAKRRPRPRAGPIHPRPRPKPRAASNVLERRTEGKEARGERREARAWTARARSRAAAACYPMSATRSSRSSCSDAATSAS